MMRIHGIQKILVADKDAKTVQMIKQLFPKEGAKILSARSADLAIEIAWQKKPDLVMVNTSLIDLSGWDLVGILKKNEPTRRIPLIMMDHPGRIEDEVRALNLGADDYIIKPFRPELILARIKAVLRRYITRQKNVEPDEILKSGLISVNMSTHKASVKERHIRLAPKEFALLYLFIKNKNRVLNRVFLSSTIWEREYYETSHTIDRHVANLRKKLGEEGSRIETLHTIGYKFIEEE